jgi:uncharacterized protein YegJ (DUF2314 family)
MRHMLGLVLGCAMMTVVGCGPRSTPATLAPGDYDQAEMDAAIAKARGEVDRFIAELKTKTGDSHAVKAPITDGEKVEHFWLTDVVYDGTYFEGVIGNDPGIVGNVKFGQKWKVTKQEMSDWLFMRDGKMHGNYTLRPLLKTMPAAEAAKLRSILAE